MPSLCNDTNTFTFVHGFVYIIIVAMFSMFMFMIDIIAIICIIRYNSNKGYLNGNDIMHKLIAVKLTWRYLYLFIFAEFI